MKLKPIPEAIKALFSELLVVILAGAVMTAIWIRLVQVWGEK